MCCYTIMEQCNSHLFFFPFFFNDMQVRVSGNIWSVWFVSTYAELFFFPPFTCWQRRSDVRHLGWNVRIGSLEACSLNQDGRHVVDLGWNPGFWRLWSLHNLKGLTFPPYVWLLKQGTTECKSAVRQLKPSMQWLTTNLKRNHSRWGKKEKMDGVFTLSTYQLKLQPGWINTARWRVWRCNPYGWCIKGWDDSGPNGLDQRLLSEITISRIDNKVKASDYTAPLFLFLFIYFVPIMLNTVGTFKVLKAWNLMSLQNIVHRQQIHEDGLDL